MVIALILILALPVLASEPGVDLPFQLIVDSPDSEHVLYEGEIPTGICDVTAIEGGNNKSVHPDNDLTVQSVNTVTLFDVERASGVSTVADGPLDSDGTATVILRLGGDGIYSADLILHFDCEEPSSSTTTTTPSTTIGPSTTTTLTTTTTMVVTTTELSTTTTASTVPVTTTTIPVTTTVTDSTDTTEPPKELPLTGASPALPAALALLLVVTGGLGLAWSARQE